ASAERSRADRPSNAPLERARFRPPVAPPGGWTLQVPAVAAARTRTSSTRPVARSPGAAGRPTGTGGSDQPHWLSPPSLQRPLETERVPAPPLEDDTPALGLELIEKFLQCGDGLRAGCICIFEPEVGRMREGTS